MIIDAHNHPDWHKHDFNAFIKNMDDNNIDKTWILSWETPFGEYDPYYNSLLCGPILEGSAKTFPIPFTRCLAYKEKAPDRFVLGYAPDPRRPDSISALKSAIDMYGVQVCGEIKLRALYDNPDFIEFFNFCGDAGVPVTLHFDYPEASTVSNPYLREYFRKNWWYGGSIDNLERLLQACPNTKFLGHAPGFWCHISNDDLGLTQAIPKGPVIKGGKIEEFLQKYPNLYCDMSAGSGYFNLSRDLDYTYYLFNKYPDRFLYARDYFDSRHQELIESLNLNKDVKELIYHGNAERLIKKI